MPEYWPGGVRREGGASSVCGFCMERGKAGVCAVVWGIEQCFLGGEREPANRLIREAVSTDAACAGGPARSSEEAPVMGVERRGRLICDVFIRATECSWEGSGGYVRCDG